MSCRIHDEGKFDAREGCTCITQSRRRCRESDPSWPFPCNCDDCCRAAAGQWRSLMDRVMEDDLSLSEAQAVQAVRDSGSYLDLEGRK